MKIATRKQAIDVIKAMIRARLKRANKTMTKEIIQQTAEKIYLESPETIKILEGK